MRKANRILPQMAAGGTYFFLRFMYLFYFLTALGVSCCTKAFSCFSDQGPLFIAVHRLLIAVAAASAERSLCGAQAQKSWRTCLVAHPIQSLKGAPGKQSP